MLFENLLCHFTFEKTSSSQLFTFKTSSEVALLSLHLCIFHESSVGEQSSKNNGQDVEQGLKQDADQEASLSVVGIQGDHQDEEQESNKELDITFDQVSSRETVEEISGLEHVTSLVQINIEGT
ncbi:hypothetical protein TEA_005066 [Camellia sinensis var. sinensis]|uniref:Uncharacterized protein n=1 Tax=Camellia sinensis var. sinensis TaxID=542762 RepID=A0A4V3WMG0_CAMSN|nr:hypothetical protein TEA_005066 [Camellia sinensis var. sinensis]